MNNSCSKSKYLSKLVVVFLLFSSVTFAYNIDDLSNAIYKNDVEKVSRVLNDEGVNPQEGGIYSLPSVEIGKALLDHEKNPMSVVCFFKRVAGISMSQDIMSYEEQMASKISLIKLAIDRGLVKELEELDPTGLEGFMDRSPSYEVCELLLDNGFDPDFFLSHFLVYCRHDTIYSNGIVDLAIRKKADPNKLVLFCGPMSSKFRNIVFGGEKPITPENFLDLTLGATVERRNDETGEYGIDYDLLAIKDSLVSWVIKEKNADLQKLPQSSPSSIGLDNLERYKKLLIDYGMPKERFLNEALYSSVTRWDSEKDEYVDDEKRIALRDSLIEFAEGKVGSSEEL